MVTARWIFGFPCLDNERAAIVLLMTVRTELEREQWKILIDRSVGRAGGTRYTEHCVSTVGRRLGRRYLTTGGYAPMLTCT